MNRLMWLTVLLLLTPLPGWGGRGLPASYPEAFDDFGVVSEVHPREEMVVIMDRSYPVAPGAPLHTPSRSNASWEGLEAGQTVGFTLTRGRDGRSRIAELWLLPPGITPRLGP